MSKKMNTAKKRIARQAYIHPRNVQFTLGTNQSSTDIPQFIDIHTGTAPDAKQRIIDNLSQACNAQPHPYTAGTQYNFLSYLTCELAPKLYSNE